MMKKHWSISLLPILLFAVFAIAVLSALSLGASVYAKASERAEHQFNYRSATQFISTKIEQAESPDKIFTGNFFGLPSILITSDYGGVVYNTRLYVSDGFLCELFYPDGIEMRPADGERILPLHSLKVSAEGELLWVVLDFDGEKSETLYFNLGFGGAK